MKLIQEVVVFLSGFQIVLLIQTIFASVLSVSMYDLFVTNGLGLVVLINSLLAGYALLINVRKFDD